MGARAYLATWLLLAPLAAHAQADDPCPQGGVACMADHAASLLDAGQAREALDWLKAHPEGAQGARGTLLRARAYLALGNRAWAARVLLARLEEAPDDCQARTWLAWVRLADADVAGSREALASAPGCPDTPQEGAREALLRATLADQAGDKDGARAALAGLRARWRTPAMYPEDRPWLAHLLGRVAPEERPPVELRADARVGWTSNALLGSPLDPQQGEGSFSSALSDLDLAARVGGPALGWARPDVEVDARASGYLADSVRNLSTLSLALVPGVSWRAGGVVIHTAYRGEALLLAGGDAYGGGPLWYSEAHRGELDVSPLPGLTILAGAGWRSFRDLGRTRAEADLSVGGGGALGARLHLLGALSGRVYRAQNRAWNAWGGTGLGALNVALGRDWSARAVASLALDAYPDSRGVFAATAARRDLHGKGRVEAWTPAWGGVRLGVSVQVAHRWSTASRYAFTDLRTLGLVRWRFDADPWLPAARAAADHVPLDTGFAGGGGGVGERIQDLLRQDEDARRGSSCMD